MTTTIEPTPSVAAHPWDGAIFDGTFRGAADAITVTARPPVRSSARSARPQPVTWTMPSSKRGPRNASGQHCRTSPGWQSCRRPPSSSKQLQEPAALASHPGNAAILKPDPRTSISGGMAIAALFEEAGLPSGVLHVLPGGGDIGAAIVAHPGIPCISFTGSTAAGRKIGAAAGPLLKKVHLGLGATTPCS